MSHLISMRQQQQSWSRRALGLFVAIWLNLALQPCAMAYQAEDHDCPHCPPAQTHEHGGMHGNMDQKMPCADGLSDCAVDDDLNVDARGGQLKVKDAPVDAAIAIVPRELEVQFPPPADTATLPRYASVHPGAPPPLHVLYCVYLK